MSELPKSRESVVFGVDHGMRDYALIDRVSGESISTNLRFLKVVYGLNVLALDHWEPEDTRIKGLPRAYMWEALQVLRQEIIKYPPEFIKAYVQNARLAGYIEKQHPRHKQKRIEVGGLADVNGNVCLGQCFRDESFTRRIVHHEIEHCASFACNWLKSEDTSKWQKYNPQSGLYIGDRYWDLTDVQKRRFKTRGFAGLYGRINIEEDRATIAEILMTDPENTYQQGTEDEVLGLKIVHLKSDYAKRTNNRMNEQYFEDLAAGIVGEGYWEISRIRKIFVFCQAQKDYRLGLYRKAYMTT